MALTAEVGGLSEIFQWMTEVESGNLEKEKLDMLQEELADILIYTLRLADINGIDILQAIERKLIKNGEKYPVDKCFGIATKYCDL